MKKLINPFRNDETMKLLKDKVCHILQKNGDRIESIGSGVFLKLSDNRYGLLSAEHVLNQKNICIPTEESYSDNPSYNLLEGKRYSSKKEDWAFVILDKLSYQQIMKADYNISPIGNPAGFCIFAGFPITKNRTKAAMVQNRPYAYSGQEIPQDEYTNYSLDRTINIAVHYDKKKTINSETRKKMQFPDPHGMSGGGVFNKNGELVAIITNQSEDGKILWGIRLSHILNELYVENVELRDMIVDNPQK